MEKQLLGKEVEEKKNKKINGTAPRPKVFLRDAAREPVFFFFPKTTVHFSLDIGRRRGREGEEGRESRAIFARCKQSRLLHFSRIYFSIRPMLSVEVLSRSEFFERDTLRREIIFHGDLAEKCP